MKRKRMKETPRKTILLITSTEAESLYFSQMRKDCRYTNLTVLHALEAQTVEEQITFAAKQRLKGHYNIVWCVFSAQAMNVDAGNIDEISAYAEKKRVKLAWNAPDVSLWYLLHLQIPSEPIQDVSVITSALRGVLPGFSADAEYLLKGGSSIHLKLFNAKAQAVVNASTYNAMAASRGRKLQPVQMTRLLNDITQVCGTADMSHNQKLIGLKNG